MFTNQRLLLSRVCSLLLLVALAAAACGSDAIEVDAEQVAKEAEQVARDAAQVATDARAIQARIAAALNLQAAAENIGDGAAEESEESQEGAQSVSQDLADKAAAAVSKAEEAVTAAELANSAEGRTAESVASAVIAVADAQEAVNAAKATVFDAEGTVSELAPQAESALNEAVANAAEAEGIALEPSDVASADAVSLSAACSAVSAENAQGSVIYVEFSADVIRAALPICGAVDDATADNMLFQSCPDSDVPHIFWGDAGGETDLVMFGHIMVRLHPVDTPAEVPADPNVPSDWFDPLSINNDEARPVVVLDGGEHGVHATAIVEAMTSGSIEYRRIDPIYGPENFLITSEAAVIEALKEIGADGVNDGTIINMSFGGYNCDIPTSLEQAMIDLEGQGATFTVSAGNDEQHIPQLWPAGFGAGGQSLSASVTTVGSISTGEVRSCFSNTGPVVQYLAVGEEVRGGDRHWSGTSFAAPQVAAALATGTLEANDSIKPAENVTEPEPGTARVYWLRPSLVLGDDSRSLVIASDGLPVTIVSTCDPASGYAPDPNIWELVGG